MSGTRPTHRESVANRRLREANLRHLIPTLQVLSMHALVETRDRDHPRGWIAASNEWLQDQTGLTRPSITAHIRALIGAGEIFVWEPARPQAGRPREFVVRHIAARRALLEASARDYARNHDPLRRMGTRGKSWGKSTIPACPLFSSRSETAKSSESSEAVAPHGHAGKVAEAALVVRARRSGRKTTDGDRVDNFECERVDHAPSDPLRESRPRSWSDVVAHCLNTTRFESQPTRHERGVSVGLGRCLDLVTIEQGPDAAGDVFARAVTRTRHGGAFATALREELKDALDLDGLDGEERFATICADRSIPMTIPRVDRWPSLDHQSANTKETTA